MMNIIGNSIGYYYNSLFMNQYGDTVPAESPISPSNQAIDVITDMQKHLDITGCKEVIIVPANTEQETKTTVIDMDPKLPLQEKKDDILIIMDRPGKVDGGESHKVVDIQDQMEAASGIDPALIKTPSQVSKMLLDLKTYDSSLKILSNMFKTLGMKNESAGVKKIRNFVRYVMSMKSVVDGRATIDLNKMQESAVKRTELINSAFTYSGLLSDTLAVVAENLKNGKFTDYVGNLGAKCATVAGIVGVPTSSLKLIYKLSAFEATKELGQQDAPPPAHIQNIIILRSGVEALREVTKVAVLLTGFSNPVVATTLAVSGVVTGVAGLYLMYNKPSAEPNKQDSIPLTQDKV